MAHRLLRDPKEDGWERSDMPIVCETCLGPNPFVRMQRMEYGGTCHISGRPYTVFRWRPGNDARYKKTIICQEVAKAKNVCQVCLLDLEYNLPVQVRDQALGMTNEDEPQSAVGKEYQLHRRETEGENGSSFMESRPNDLLLRLQRTTPYYKRNQARVCSFFAKGQCTRGAECPYRHEMPTTGELSEQNIKDRFYGINDPVANKMLRRVGELPTLEPPEDTTITTLFVGGLTSDITEADLHDHFYAFGEISGIRKVESKACAFITFATREAAEKAAKELYGKLIVKGVRLRLSWGKPQQAQPGKALPGQDPMQPSASGRPPFVPPQAAMAMAASQQQKQQQELFSLYPSMAPDQMGTRIPAAGEKQPQPGGLKRPAAVDSAPEPQPGAAAAAPEDAAAPKRPRPAQAPNGAPAPVPGPMHGFGARPAPMGPVPPMSMPVSGPMMGPPPHMPPPMMPPHGHPGFRPMMPPPGMPVGPPPGYPPPMMPPPHGPPGFRPMMPPPGMPPPGMPPPMGPPPGMTPHAYPPPGYAPPGVRPPHQGPPGFRPMMQPPPGPHVRPPPPQAQQPHPQQPQQPQQQPPQQQQPQQ